MTHRPIRFGFHGSGVLAQRIIAAAGHDPARFELSQYDPSDPFRRLRRGELDVMIVKFTVAEPDLDIGPVLATDARAAVLSARHPLAGRADLSIEDVAGYPLFQRPGAMPESVWDQVVPRTTPSGRALRRAYRAESVREMLELVARTEALHLSVASLADIAPPAIRVIPIHDLPPAPVALAWRRHMVTSQLRDFLAATRPVESCRAEL
ncbi:MULTISPECIES: LysR substrate-binding domain-containing protein [unclassified Nocardia]|uniref:LysR substrate-binding domain-containing protein n=1 Tax=unclassified Nocardia TaxID=2637762 RepID=UPI001CE40F5E|nr:MULTISPECIES: LysR substrate-binding domain-containing protein [unclassified Nocardia]